MILELLPPEIIDTVFKYAGPSGQAAAFHTCKQLNALVAGKFDPKQVLKDVIRCGNINMYMWASLAGYYDQLPCYHAATYGNLDVLKLHFGNTTLHEQMVEFPPLVETALQSGHIDVIKWLDSHINPINNGSVLYEEYIYYHFAESLLVQAVALNNVQCIIWVLTESRIRGQISDGFVRNVVRNSKSPEICQLIVDTRPNAFSELMVAPKFANLKMLEWMLSNGLINVDGINRTKLYNHVCKFIRCRFLKKKRYGSRIAYVRGKTLPHILNVIACDVSTC